MGKVAVCVCDVYEHMYTVVLVCVHINIYVCVREKWTNYKCLDVHMKLFIMLLQFSSNKLDFLSVCLSVDQFVSLSSSTTCLALFTC